MHSGRPWLCVAQRAASSSVPRNLPCPAARRSWAKISGHYISGIWMAGSHAAFAVGQLAPEYNGSEPTALLK